MNRTDMMNNFAVKLFNNIKNINRNMIASFFTSAYPSQYFGLVLFFIPKKINVYDHSHNNLKSKLESMNPILVRRVKGYAI